MKEGLAYIRDGRAPVPEKEATSRLMRSNKAKNTKPEVILRKALWKNNIKGYRLHWNKVPGRPDIAFPGKKLAVFVNGCFWHRCPHCNLPLPKSNEGFWTEKFERNTYRDKMKLEQLQLIGWTPLTVWECEIKDDLQGCIDQIKDKLKQ